MADGSNSQGVDVAEKRTIGRLDGRFACTLHSELGEHHGIVLNLSPQGIFVKTSAKLEPGTKLRLTLKPPRCEEFDVFGEVARKQTVPPRLRAISDQGIGIHFTSPPPEPFFALYSRSVARRQTELTE